MNKPSRDQVKAGIVGGVLVAVLVVLVIFSWAGYVVWVRARHGEDAYEFIDAQMKAQQAQQAKSAAAPVAAPTPESAKPTTPK